jgi:hypothetical protein
MPFPPHSLPRVAVPCSVRSLSSKPHGGGAQSCGLGLFYGVPNPQFRNGDIRISQVPWFPVEHMPRSSAPAAVVDSTRCRPPTCCLPCLRPCRRRRLACYRDNGDFGAQSRGLCSRCVRFAGEVTLDDATLAAEWRGHTFSDGTFTRWGTLLSFVLVELHPSLLSARAFPGAPQTRHTTNRRLALQRRSWWNILVPRLSPPRSSVSPILRNENLPLVAAEEMAAPRAAHTGPKEVLPARVRRQV